MEAVHEIQPGPMVYPKDATLMSMNNEASPQIDILERMEKEKGKFYH